MLYREEVDDALAYAEAEKLAAQAAMPAPAAPPIVIETDEPEAE